MDKDCLIYLVFEYCKTIDKVKYIWICRNLDDLTCAVVNLVSRGRKIVVEKFYDTDGIYLGKNHVRSW